MNVREKIIEALHYATNALDDPNIAPLLLSGQDVRLEEVSSDSLARLEFIMKLEDFFDVELDESDFSQETTIANLEVLIQERISNPVQ